MVVGSTGRCNTLVFEKRWSVGHELESSGARTVLQHRWTARTTRGVHDEFLLAATARNLKKPAQNITRPPPSAIACCQRQSLLAHSDGLGLFHFFPTPGMSMPTSFW